MSMKYLVFVLFILISCNKNVEKQKVENFDLEKLDVFNNEDINIFIQSFLLNQEPNQKDELKDLIGFTKFIGNELEKDSLILDGNNLRMVSQKELDSLISKEDWKFIVEQIKDKKDYYVDGKYFNQKIFNSDSLRKENLKFYERESKVMDSLVKISTDLARQYDAKSSLEHSRQIRKLSPYVYIEKPLFTKDKKRVIFSYTLSYLDVVAIYEYKNKKWRRIKSVREIIS